MNDKDHLPIPPNDVELDTPTFLAKLQDGNANAWEAFMDHYSYELYEYLLARLPDNEAAQDVLSDTLLGIVQGIKHIAQTSDLRTFIYTIAAQKLDAFQQRTISHRVPHWLLEQELSETDAFAQLTAQEKDVLMMRYHQGLSLSEIAQRLGETTSSAERLLRETRRQISQAEDTILSSLLPKDYELARKTARPQLFAAIYPMLHLQQLLCEDTDMVEEAAIFAQARATLEQMATVSQTNFVAELRQFMSELTSETPTQLAHALLQRHPKYDSSRQL